MPNKDPMDGLQQATVHALSDEGSISRRAPYPELTQEELDRDLSGTFEAINEENRKDFIPPLDKPAFPVAIKADGLKPKFDLLPWDALAEIQKVYQFGSQKYDARNWEKGFNWLRLWNAAMRHLTAWEAGESKDPETGLSHMVHASFCVLGLVAHELRALGKDDRDPPVKIEPLS